MSIAEQKLQEIRAQVQTHIASTPTRLSAERQQVLRETIRAQLLAHNAVIVAHYYTAPEIQALLRKREAVFLTLWKWRVSVEIIPRTP